MLPLERATEKGTAIIITIGLKVEVLSEVVVENEREVTTITVMVAVTTMTKILYSPG